MRFKSQSGVLSVGAALFAAGGSLLAAHAGGTPALQPPQNAPTEPPSNPSSKRPSDTLILFDAPFKDALLMVLNTNQLQYKIDNAAGADLYATETGTGEYIVPGKPVTYRYAHRAPLTGLAFLCRAAPNPVRCDLVKDNGGLVCDIKPVSKRVLANRLLPHNAPQKQMPTYTKETDVPRRVCGVLRHDVPVKGGETPETTWCALLETGIPDPYGKGNSMVERVQKGAIVFSAVKKTAPLLVVDISEKGITLQAKGEMPFDVPLAPLPKK